jgi:hypothetical protein
VSEFDLDGFIGEAVEIYAAKHGPNTDGSAARITRAFDRAKHDQQNRERIDRSNSPKMAVREASNIVLPWRKGG